MPCTHYTAAEVAEMQGAELRLTAAKLNAATNAACAALGAMTEAQISALPPDVRAWWSQHRKDDAKRRDR